VVHLHPEAAVFEAILAGWTAQQTARMLGLSTIESRLAPVRGFAGSRGSPASSRGGGSRRMWRRGRWRCVALRRGGARAHSTLRSYQNTIAMFCDHLVDPRYEWATECVERFGTHPVQICHEWNRCPRG
jgi:integrase/recombinase XerC